MPWLIIFIVGGIVLRANPEWFGGAETVGTVLLACGIGGAVISLAIFLFILAFGVRR